MKILLAEGILRHQISMADALRMKGHCVHIVDNGIEALQRLRATNFDLIFLDAQLPLLDGPSALKVIRQYLALGCQPRVVMTSEGPSGLPTQVPEGVDATLVKPASAVELERLVHLLQPQAVERLRVPTEDEPLDEKEIQQLLGEDGDLSFLTELGQVFAVHGMQLVNKMLVECEKSEWSKVKESARALADAGSTLSAKLLGKACKAIEAAPESDAELVNNACREFLRAAHRMWQLIPARMGVEEQVLDSVIYIVDDEEHNVRLLERMLRKHGYSRIVATTVPEFFESCVQQHLPDLVLLDLHMGSLSGLDLLDSLTQLHTAAPRVPVLMLTGDTRTDVRRSALQKGARDFVNKPFDPPEVLARIRNLLEARLAQGQLLQQNRLLEEQVQKRTMQVRERQMDILRRLGMAAEYRDDQTGNHIRRVGRYCAVLAEAIGLSPETCECILHASQLHDIGKIAIPDSVLLKPGKLDADEWVTMKNHAVLGARILHGGDCEMLRMAEEIALTHHERWDGNGYPNGLKAEEIPLAGRIVGICDVFDALTSERPYKRAWTPEEAVREIRNNSGTQFDPVLVEHFNTVLPRIMQIYEKLGARTPATEVAA